MTTELKPHQERVIVERDDLDSRLLKLNSFIESELFATVDGAEQELLQEQATAMSHYRNLLNRRLALWGVE